MSARTVVLILLLCVPAVPPAVGQSGASVQVSARAEPMAATVGETIAFTVRVEGAPATVVRIPDRPRTVRLKPLRKAPQTRPLRGGNGGADRRGVTFSWRLRAQQAGTARIRPVTVVVRGERYRTSAIRVRVTAPDRSRSTLAQPEGGSSTLDEQDLFVRASASATRAYQNEQVVVEYRLFYRPGIRLRHSRLADSWDAPGFWREELTVASRPTPETRRVKGRRYETVVLKRVALFPTRPGTLRVDPLRIETEAQGTVRMRRGGPALRGRFEPVQLASQRLSVRVRSLPSGAPASFNGAVGQFTLAARVDAESLAVGTAIPLRVQVEGTGSLPTLPPPPVESPSNIEVYEPTVEMDIDRGGRRIEGTKTFTYTLVPRAGGRQELPPVTFSYFDPDARRYETLQARVPPLQVSGKAASEARHLSGRTGDGLPVGDVTALMSADEASWVRPDQAPLHRQPWAYLALLFPLLGVGGAAAYRQWGGLVGTPQSEASDASLDAARARLREARHQREEEGDAAIYEAVEEELRSFVDTRLGRNGTASSRAALDRHLARHDVPEELRHRLYELLDRCDEAQYSPGEPAHTAPEEALDDAHRVLRGLDEHFPAAAAPPDSS